MTLWVSYIVEKILFRILDRNWLGSRCKEDIKSCWQLYFGLFETCSICNDLLSSQKSWERGEKSISHHIIFFIPQQIKEKFRSKNKNLFIHYCAASRVLCAVNFWVFSPTQLTAEGLTRISPKPNKPKTRCEIQSLTTKWSFYAIYFKKFFSNHQQQTCFVKCMLILLLHSTLSSHDNHLIYFFTKKLIIVYFLHDMSLSSHSCNALFQQWPRKFSSSDDTIKRLSEKSIYIEQKHANSIHSK